MNKLCQGKSLPSLTVIWEELHIIRQSRHKSLIASLRTPIEWATSSMNKQDWNLTTSYIPTKFDQGPRRIVLSDKAGQIH